MVRVFVFGGYGGCLVCCWLCFVFVVEKKSCLILLLVVRVFRYLVVFLVEVCGWEVFFYVFLVYGVFVDEFLGLWGLVGRISVSVGKVDFEFGDWGWNLELVLLFIVWLFRECVFSFCFYYLSLNFFVRYSFSFVLVYLCFSFFFIWII